MSYADQEIKGNTKFLKIEAGAPMIIRLLDAEPFEVMKHSTGKEAVDGKFQVECTGSDVCPFCQDGSDPTQKFIVNVFNHTLSKVQLFEYGPTIAKMLQKIAINLEEENQDIMNYDLKIEAEGSRLTKKYMITPRTTATPVPPGLVKFKVGNNELGF